MLCSKELEELKSRQPLQAKDVAQTLHCLNEKRKEFEVVLTAVFCCYKCEFNPNEMVSFKVNIANGLVVKCSFLSSTDEFHLFIKTCNIVGCSYA